MNTNNLVNRITAVARADDNYARSRDTYVGALLSRAARTLAAKASDWLRRRRAIAELSQMDPRMMADIGLDRAAFSVGIIRRIDEDKARAAAAMSPVSRPAVRHAAEPHLAPATTPTAANDARLAA